MEFEDFIDPELEWWSPLNTQLLEEDAFLNFMLEKRLEDQKA